MRLTRSKDFADVFRRGKRVRGEYLDLRFVKNGRGSARFAVTVPKRVGSAVKRNLLKRLIREYMRSEMESLKKFDIVIRVCTWPHKTTKKEKILLCQELTQFSAHLRRL